MVRQVAARQDKVRYKRGEVWHGVAWYGLVRLGAARYVMVQAWFGWVVCGKLR